MDISIFSGKVRVRVCGLLRQGDQILLIRHHSLGPKNYLWLPPGGGVEFGESAEQTLIREFKEETNLTVTIDRFLFVFELINKSHHAVELFYEVKHIDGEMELGKDPEFSDDRQIIEDIRFMPASEIDNMDPSILHNIFTHTKSAKNIFNLSGLYSFKY